MKKKVKFKKISLNLPVVLLDAIDREADRIGDTSRSQLIRKWVGLCLEHLRKPRR